MRFPLDYYRILGVPIHGTPEQIDQAYTDRLQQRSQYKYSTVTVAARKQLLEQSHAILSEPELRQAYDEQVLVHHDGMRPEQPNSPPDNRATPSNDSPEGPDNPLTNVDFSTTTNSTPAARPAVATLPRVETGIEIEDYQLAGALLLLYEQGDYATVIELGSPYLANHAQARSPNLQRPSNSALSESDLSLTVALAHFELGREQWQQRHYETAAAKLQTGLNLLRQEGLFVEVQQQMERDVYRLRPYRILELLATEPEDSSQHQQGLDMLKSMLQDRKGIDGNGNDRSGLSVDECLKFIVQVRSYLSAREQQELFEQEAARPSAAGTYLAAYALIARGFAEQQPAQIRRARKILQRLSGRQDVNLELASCHLLLGQTETALACLDQSRDEEALDFIRTHYSQPDNLIPGLYYYTQKWLQEMVFPYFRDLADQPVSLKAYFEDEQIQQYLDSLPENDNDLSGQAVAEPTRLEYRSEMGMRRSESLENPNSHQIPSPGGAWSEDAYAQAYAQTVPTRANGNSDWNWTQVPLPAVPAAPPESVEDGAFDPSEFTETDPNAAISAPHIEPSRGAYRAEPSQQPGQPSVASPQRQRRPVSGASSPKKKAPAQQTLTEPGQQKSWRLGMFLPILLGTLVLGGIAAFARHLFLPNPRPEPAAEQPASPALSAASPTLAPGSPTPLPTTALSPSPSTSSGITSPASPSVTPGASPTSSASPSTSPGVASPGNPSTPGASPSSSPVTTTSLDNRGADQVVRSWQRAKAAALGKDYQVEQLSGVLTGRALTTWQNSAQEYRDERGHWEYKLADVKIESVTPETDPNQAVVIARISESATFFANGQAQPDANSYQNDSYRVQYTMIRKDNRWLISSMKQIDN